MMKVLHGIAAKIFSRELAFGPGLVKGMRQQIVPGDAGIKLFTKFLNIHLSSFELSRGTAGYAKQKDCSTAPEIQSESSETSPS